MNLLIRVFFMIMFVSALLSNASAEVSSVSVEEREKEIRELVKESVLQKNMSPEVTIQLQGPSASSLAQPTVSTLAQPHENLTMASILDIIKTTTNTIKPDEKPDCVK